MKVGDLIKRKKALAPYFRDERENGKFGIVMELRHGGKPRHPTALILYPPSGCQYEIARSLLEVISEGG